MKQKRTMNTVRAVVAAVAGLLCVNGFGESALMKRANELCKELEETKAEAKRLRDEGDAIGSAKLYEKVFSHENDSIWNEVAASGEDTTGSILYTRSSLFCDISFYVVRSKAVKQYNDNMVMLWKKAKAHYAKGELDEAVKAVDKILEWVPDESYDVDGARVNRTRVESARLFKDRVSQDEKQWQAAIDEFNGSGSLAKAESRLRNMAGKCICQEAMVMSARQEGDAYNIQVMLPGKIFPVMNLRADSSKNAMKDMEYLKCGKKIWFAGVFDFKEGTAIDSVTATGIEVVKCTVYQARKPDIDDITGFYESIGE